MEFGQAARQSGARGASTVMAPPRNHLKPVSPGEQSIIMIELPSEGGARSSFPMRGGNMYNTKASTLRGNENEAHLGGLAV